jgi:hypothetical protein
MALPHNTLTALQKASICVASSDDSNLSDMLVACQFIMGCYSTQGEPSPRLREKLDRKFTPTKNLGITPQQKFSFGASKGLDFAS